MARHRQRFNFNAHSAGQEVKAGAWSRTHSTRVDADTSKSYEYIERNLNAWITDTTTAPPHGPHINAVTVARTRVYYRTSTIVVWCHLAIDFDLGDTERRLAYSDVLGSVFIRECQRLTGYGNSYLSLESS
jgi:hypothetical protein